LEKAQSPLIERRTSNSIEFDGVRIHYHDAGKGQMLVILHGGGHGRLIVMLVPKRNTRCIYGSGISA
jgi:hypothetical protein